jgi:uncharacterized protein
MNPHLKPILFGALLLAGAFGSSAMAQTASPPAITVTAEGRVSAVPDMAHVSVGVVDRQLTADAALDGMSTAMARVLERLAASGIAPEDMQTGQLYLQPYYEQPSPDAMPEQAGFEASTTLNVRVRDLPVLGKVLDAVVADGANQLGGVRFDVADPLPLLNEARRAAVAEAQARAALYAEAAGVSLGALQSLTEQSGSFGGPVMMEMRMMDAASGVPVAEGEVSLTATVTMVWAIE